MRKGKRKGWKEGDEMGRGRRGVGKGMGEKGEQRKRGKRGRK